MTEALPLAVDIRNVTKHFGDFVALDDVSLGIQDNEFFTLLGPSGCGKTTLLRLVAGFLSPSDGSILLYNENIGDLPPNKRPVNTVFQQYALFPHMDVTNNVMFGLKRLGIDDSQARQRTGEVLELVQLSDLANRLPTQLSGGQQQRVALARALAPNPKVLLLDEPLSALDLKLRQAVRIELQQIQHETGITFIFVTHDQEEALTMSDRIAVLNNGQLQQIGTAREIYDAPRNRFVANFIGETNIIDVMVNEVQGQQALCTLNNGATNNATRIACSAPDGAPTGNGHLSIRPERIEVCDPESGLIRGTVFRQTYLGTDVHVIINIGGDQHVTARIQNSSRSHIPATGDAVGLNFDKDAARLLID